MPFFLFQLIYQLDFNEKGVIFLGQADNSCAKEIYKKIKTDILNLNIKDGDFLTLASLAKQYDVSKTPIRDALSALEIKGYLLSLPRKGYLVKPVTPRNMRELFQMRLILEIAAVELAIKNSKDSQLLEVLELAKQFPKNSSHNIDFFNELNFNFHMAIVKLSQNLLLVENYTSIFENLSRILRIDSNNIDFLSEKEEHINLATALINKDFITAKEITTTHISKLEKRIYSSHRGI